MNTQNYIVAVTGGRNNYYISRIENVLTRLHTERRITFLVHGGCRGADSVCRDWAERAGVYTAAFPIQQSLWLIHGKAAGPTRNRLMLEVTRPDLLVAFAGGTGTASCIEAAELLGIPIRDERRTL